VSTTRGAPKPDSTIRVLSRAALPSDTVALARYLIGKIVVREAEAGRMSGRIVETEAYVIGDAACHAHRGMTPRNRALFLARGHAYVYFIYGNFFMLNVAGERPGVGAGVLIRALEPLEGIDLMQKNRSVTRLEDLARGPGRLCQALKIDRRLDGVDLCHKGALWLGADGKRAGTIAVSTRIGLNVEADRELRFFVRGSPYVSGPKALNGPLGANP
jgi:DNA-3-methyladenine glycosylase